MKVNRKSLRMNCVPLSLRASSQKNGTPSTFELTAYTGGIMQLNEWPDPVIVELSSVQPPRQDIPVLYDHNSHVSHVVGHSTSVQVSASGIAISGRFVPGNLAREVQEKAAAGYPWQLSIGGRSGRVRHLAKEESATVNGRQVTGPLDIVQGLILREVSFVVLGADKATSAVFARLAEGAGMTFEEWLKSLGWDSASLSESQREALQKAYDSEQGTAEAEEEEEEAEAEGEEEDAEAEEDDTEAEGEEEETAARNRPNNVNAGRCSSPVQATRNRIATEMDRIDRVRRIAARHPEIRARAVRAGWSPERTELAVLRASRPSVAAGSPSGGPNNDLILAAALGQSLNLPVDQNYTPQTLEAAHSRFRGRLSLHELLIEAAIGGGYTGSRTSSAVRSNLRQVLQAAFSTTTLPGILSNTMNKTLLQSFMAVENVYSRISTKASVSDFKEVTHYRLTASTVMEQVGPDGQLKHGELGEESYGNAVDTYGTMFSITRRMLINDDLGALNDVPRKIGRGAALKLNKVFWTAFLDNATYFTTGRKNYIEGSTTALSSEGLRQGVKLFRDQTDSDGEPLAIEPKLLLIPTALEQTAAELFVSTNLNTGGSSTSDRVPNSNVYARRFEPIVSTYLNNATISGGSATAWYLLADPMDIPVIEIAYLNGSESPVVESAEADFNILGIQMRGYFDFGVRKQDYRGGIKSKGAA